MVFKNSPPEWENEGTEPSEELKSSGFQAGYKPPASIFNWFWSKVSVCLTELQSTVAGQKHVDLMYRDEDKSESNTVYFIIDADAPESAGVETAEEINAVAYSNVIFAEDEPETADAENWFKTEEGDTGVSSTSKIVMQDGLLKVLTEPEEDTTFLNE